MGSAEVRNLLLSKQLKRSENRILIIDDNQIRYNEIVKILQDNNHLIQTTLLDDLKSFEKQLNAPWDLVIFGRAYDIRIEQAAALIQTSDNADIPILLLTPNNYHYEQYMSYIQKGVYDVVNLDYQDRFYISVIRALSYGRTLQVQKNLSDDLENVKLKKIEQIEEQNKAVAVIQEGIHVEANTEYLNLFGIKDQADIMGVPLLDVIQPKALNDFKSRFKKVSQGQFEHGHFDVATQNPHAAPQNPLDVEFIASHEDDAVQITIATATAHSVEPSQNNVASLTLNTYEKVKRFLQNHPAKENAIILFSLASCPEAILSSDWNTFKGYFDQLADFIKTQINGSVFKLETALYATVVQAENKEILNSRLTALAALEKPQLVTLGDKTYQQNVKIGYSFFTIEQLNDTAFEPLIADAYNTRLPKNSLESELEFNVVDFQTSTSLSADSTLATSTASSLDTSTAKATGSYDLAGLSLEPMPSQSAPISSSISISKENVSQDTQLALNVEPLNFNQSAILSHIQTALDKNAIQLKYQQLYDKHDSNVNTYEVTSGLIYDNAFKQISSLIELDEDQELSIKVDRWILVEACKQLHNFITQYPEAKLIVNLNRHVLLHDAQLPALVSKLLTIVGSKLSNPLILQFDEEDIAKNLTETNKVIELLRQSGAEISIRHFGSTISSEAILKQTDISLVTLDPKLTALLSNDKKLPELQARINTYLEIKPIEILAKELNDMSTFANAWNIEARFLQGDYFQKKLDHLTDVQDQ
ncbi:EAL domain-containing protein [Acinetobacter sp. 187]|uniref:EAL domain-containing protein n=1 Tax=Acinetobacter lanii TaxID=2715163 RepID=UPI00140D1E12|nr:EAL domain-containing protein [Acinetobacter lanii]NHC02382.1 EAL domain-containing protein [Acinetobacter lanii]